MTEFKVGDIVQNASDTFFIFQKNRTHVDYCSYNVYCIEDSKKYYQLSLQNFMKIRE